MAVWTNIPNANLAAGAPIRSVDTIALRDNSAYNKQNVEVELLNTQIFTTSGTWTKPTGTEFNSTDSVIAIYFGAGGGGGAAQADAAEAGAGAGGNGGAIAILAFNYGTIASSLAVTIGAGGAGSPSNSGTRAGGNGGATIFNGYQLNGGTGGWSQSLGVYYSPVASNLLGSLSKTTNSTVNDYGWYPNYDGGSGRSASANTQVNPIGNGIGGGGGGSFGVDNNGTSRSQNQAAGISILGFAGNGGNGGNPTGSAGTAPSGGGGGSCRYNAASTSGAGARGELRVYVVRGKVALDAFFGVL